MLLTYKEGISIQISSETNFEYALNIKLKINKEKKIGAKSLKV